MNRMNVFERPSEQDTEKKISHRYENIKQALPLQEEKKGRRIWVHLNEW